MGEANNKYGPTEPPLAPTEKIPSNIPMSTPKYPGVESKNKYNLEELENGFPEKAGPGGAPPMTAPKYQGVEESHKYGPVTERKQAPKGINVPIYVQDGENKYSHIPEKQPGELIQQAPVYRGVESKNTYAPSEEKVINQALLIGPCYPTVDHECKYIPEVKERAEGQLAMCGPKFRGVADTSLYNETPQRAPIEGTRLMTAPIFPGIEANNKYGPVEPELAPKEKIKLGKPFVAPNYPGVECKNTYNLDKIENGMPDPYRMDEGSIMVGPKYPGIQDSGYEYNPPSNRGQLPKVEVISAPVFVEDGANKYSVVP